MKNYQIVIKGDNGFRLEFLTVCENFEFLTVCENFESATKNANAMSIHMYSSKIGVIANLEVVSIVQVP